MGFLLNMQIKSKWKKGKMVQATILPDRQDRDEILVKYAVANNIPVVVGKQSRCDELKYIDINVQLIRLAHNFTIEFRDKEFPNGVLVDETISIEMIGWLKSEKIKISGGFN